MSRCPFCDSRTSEQYTPLYLRCECGSVFMEHMPDHPSGDYEPHKDSSGFMRLQEEYRLPFYAECSLTQSDLDYKTPDSVLDVGCGNGWFLDWCAKRGAKRLLGCDITPRTPYVETPGPLADLPRGDLFGMVALLDVLEHQPRPLEMLRDARDRAGGFILAQAPLVDAVALGYGADWRKLHAPAHCSLPSRLGLSLLAERAGLKITSEITWGGGAAFTSKVDPVHKQSWDRIAKTQNIGDEISCIMRYKL